ncbi:MAG TPA: hypothetical protein VGA05_08400 [Candidatus Bathyarchaeia archaeon]
MSESINFEEQALRIYNEGLASTVEWHKRLAEGPQPKLLESKPLLPDHSRGSLSPLGGTVW